MAIFSKKEADGKTAEVIAGSTKVEPVVEPVVPSKKEGKTIPIIRDGMTTKCSKKRLQGLLDAGWDKVKE